MKTTIAAILLAAVAVAAPTEDRFRVHLIINTNAADTNATAAAGVPATNENAVAEAVLNHLLSGKVGDKTIHAKAYFVRLMGKDPDAAFLQRLGHGCSVGSKFKAGKGALIYVDSVKMIDDATAEAHGGYEENGTTGTLNRYVVKNNNGKWEVVEDVVEAVR